MRSGSRLEELGTSELVGHGVAQEFGRDAHIGTVRRRLAGRQDQPLQGFYLVARDPLALEIHEADIVLRDGQNTIRCLADQGHRAGYVDCHPLAVTIERAQHEFGVRMPAFRRTNEPYYGRRRIGHA